MNNKKRLICAVCLLSAFVIFTALVCCVDVKAVGADNTNVGFSRLNMYVHRLTGAHLALYHLTDWLSLVPLGVVASLAAAGLIQWIQRKSLRKVDRSLLALGALYVVTAAVYLLFECIVINYRPIFIDGVLESSYPSSTTMLVLCVMPASALYIAGRAKNRTFKRVITVMANSFTALMIVGRLVSGVHWFTDIVGAVLAGLALLMLYRCFEEE
ncbi:MAG: phosphatase PAP2 family protein [Clostridia bacterium]|nr:phosphatase PAP2 family protein [Clostridia bacterium]